MKNITCLCINGLQKSNFKNINRNKLGGDIAMLIKY